MHQKKGVSRWLYQNRNKGIPNLMLWIAIGNAIVYVLTRISTTGYVITQALSFDAELILKGQVWRLVTFVFTELFVSNPFLGAVSLLFYYWIGKVLEQFWGILRFNLFYASGILIGAAVSLAVALLNRVVGMELLPIFLSATYVNLSLFLAVATLQPEAQVRIWFVLPLKMKWVAWIELAFSAFAIIRGILLMLPLLPRGILALHWLIPIAALVNYVLFFRKMIPSLFPEWVTVHHSHPKRVRQKKAAPNPDWAASYRSSTGGKAYRFKCTVCGRTDRSDPGLEFRYCSRCTGYRCYCMDHINNHTHITQ